MVRTADPTNSEEMISGRKINEMVMGVRSLLMLVALTAIARPCAAAIIELRSDVTLPNAGLISLRDLAEVHDADADFAEQLRSISIAPSPAVGRTVRFSFEEIRLRLQSQGVNLAKIEFRGPHQVDLRVGGGTAPPVRAVKTVPVTTLNREMEPTAVAKAPVPARWEQAKANEVVTAAFRRAFQTSELEARRVRIRLEVPPATCQQCASLSADRISFRERQLESTGTQTVTAVWVDAEGTVQEAAVQLTIDESPLMLAVKQSLPMGAILRPDDLFWLEAETKGAGMTRVADVIGKQASRNLKAGQPLRPEDLSTIQLIKANDIVTVTVRRAGVTVRRPYKAISSGAMNEAIQLTALDDPRVRLQAIVSGSHEAVLALDHPAMTDGVMNYERAPEAPPRSPGLQGAVR